MASHFIRHGKAPTERSSEARQAELRRIEKYRAVVEEVNSEVEREDFTPDLLQKTAELLKENPEYYTIWNHRRRIYSHEFDTLDEALRKGEITTENKDSQVCDVIQLDLQFLFPLLLKFPKCYWIWNHRLWLLQQASLRLPAPVARKFWEEELGLVGKMLNRDNRNFHGWGYRRTIIKSLEGAALDVQNGDDDRPGGSSMAKQEFDYTTKMIKGNLSNFSAWHNRSKLILRMLDEQSASDAERRQLLDQELSLIHEALCDPTDQALWFYHQTLMLTFDPISASQTMAPNLTEDDRLEYVKKEIEFIEEMLEDLDDCKWVYQALINCSLLQSKIRRKLEDREKKRVRDWLDKLKVLDPLRTGRWVDLEHSLNL